MKISICLVSVMLVGGVTAGAPPSAKASVSGEHWVSTWATAQQLAPLITPTWVKPPPVESKATSKTPPMPALPLQLKNQTVRMIVRSSVGGHAVRIQLSTMAGGMPTTVGAAHIAMHDKQSRTLPGTDRSLTFGGRPSFTIVPGAMIVSDPVNLEVPALTELAISLYLPADTGAPTVHGIGLHTTYLSDGNVVGAETLPGAAESQAYFWLADVDVLTAETSTAIIAFGDSITDGFSTTPDTWHAWPSLLADRLQSHRVTWGWSVINLGISGNRMRRDGAGLSALARFDRDVLGRPGARWLILFEGINDITFSALPGAPEIERSNAAQLIEAYGEFIAKAHLHGLNVMGATVLPYEGVWTYTEEGEAIRQTVNDWIRHGGRFDAVVDLDAAIRDPARPTRLKPEFDSGDHVHPNDKGNAAMANAIDLDLFTR